MEDANIEDVPNSATVDAFPEESKAPLTDIVFQAQPDVEPKAAETTLEPVTVDDPELDRKKRRAERFGIPLQEPSKERKKAWNPNLKRELYHRPPGFVTGIDITTEEEQRKRLERAKKFGNEIVDDEQKKLAVRAAKFGAVPLPNVCQLPASDEQLVEERKDVALGVQRRWDAIHMYGTDTMSTTDVLKYFGDYGPSWVDWINDSSCNVIFEDVNTAKRAILALTTGIMEPMPSPPPPVETPAQAESNGAESSTLCDSALGESTLSAASSDPSSPNPPLVAFPKPLNRPEECAWRRGRASVEGIIPLLRYATTLDVKAPPNERKSSMWSRASRFKRRRQTSSIAGPGGALDADRPVRKRQATRRAPRKTKRRRVTKGKSSNGTQTQAEGKAAGDVEMADAAGSESESGKEGRSGRHRGDKRGSGDESYSAEADREDGEEEEDSTV